MLELLQAVFMYFWNAAADFADTPEGHAELERILTDVEKLGVDIPFWSPPTGEPSAASAASRSTHSSPTIIGKPRKP